MFSCLNFGNFADYNLNGMFALEDSMYQPQLFGLYSNYNFLSSDEIVSEWSPQDSGPFLTLNSR
jgi:hypothetical protein